MTPEQMVYGARLRAGATLALKRADEISEELHANRVDEEAATLTVLCHALSLAIVRGAGQGSGREVAGLEIACEMLGVSVAMYAMLWHTTGRAPWEPRDLTPPG